MSKNIDAKLEAAAHEFVHECPKYSGYPEHMKTFIAGAKWQADQYAEALQLMREMAEGLLKYDRTHFESCALGYSSQCDCSLPYVAEKILKKYRASRWSEGKL